MATDAAFVIGCLALLGSRMPLSLRVFMLCLAIADNIGAIIVVAVGYSSDISLGALALAAPGMVIVRAMAMLGFRGFRSSFYRVEPSGLQLMRPGPTPPFPV